MSALTFVQISDSHLFSSTDDCHHGSNVYRNFQRILTDISQNPNVELVVFTGDLTQDHTESSYQNFVTAWQESAISVPLAYLPGNHDSPELLNKYLEPLLNSSIAKNNNLKVNALTIKHQVSQTKKRSTLIESAKWQLALLDSKSDTPSGLFDPISYQDVASAFSADKYQVILMHHHPIDVSYFIDHHGLTNKNEFWQEINKTNTIKAISCGHIHRGLVIKANAKFEDELSSRANGRRMPFTQSADLYTSPSTSIQFDPNSENVSSTGEGPGYRLFSLEANGVLNTQVIMLSRVEELT